MKVKSLVYQLLIFGLITLAVFIGSQIWLTKTDYHDVHSDINLVHKNIVAYSLLKQIEIQSEIVSCENYLFTNGSKGNTHFQNQKWVNIHRTNGFIYSIYEDQRLDPYKYLRIIAMVKGSWNANFFCGTLLSKGQYYISKASGIKIWSKNWNLNDTHQYYNPYLFTCIIPANLNIQNILFSTKPCRESEVQHFETKTQISSAPKENFTLCVKPLSFEQDVFEKLFYWIIINSILGASRIEVYIYKIPEETHLKLQHLQKIFRIPVLLHNFSYLEPLASLNENTQVWQRRRYEIISYNDCFYRNIHTSHFVVPLDIDEIIVPRNASTWTKLLEKLLLSPTTNDNFASYTVRNAYYLQQFNINNLGDKDIFFFKEIIRGIFSTRKESGKSFISTRNALTVFNHYSLDILKPGIRRIMFLSEKLVQMNHYKTNCDIVLLPECAKYLSSPIRIVDNVILKYKKEFDQVYRNTVNKFIKHNTTNVRLSLIQN